MILLTILLAFTTGFLLGPVVLIHILRPKPPVPYKDAGAGI